MYEKLVKCHHLLGTATNEHMTNTISYSFATDVSSVLPAIYRTLAPIAAADVAGALQPHFNQINAVKHAIHSNERATQRAKHSKECSICSESLKTC